MGFSFQFDDDDIDIDQNETNDLEKSPTEDPLDNITGISPQILPLNEVLESLIDVPLTFTIATVKNGITIYKRELYDVKHQLMTEDDNHNQFNENIESTLMGDDDLKKNVYEGGLKTWECSRDLIDKIAQRNLDFDAFIELGCGTALPACFVFVALLREAASNSRDSVPRFVLSDYNKSVLRLVTVPNLVINWFVTLPFSRKESLSKSFQISADISCELQLSRDLIDMFLDDVTRAVNVQLVYGSWSRQFLELVNGPEKTLILSSETIYSPQTIPVISETIVELLGPESLALVAAKDIYFGVGGTILEFLKCLEGKVQFKVNAVEERGLNRSVVEVRSGKF